MPRGYLGCSSLCHAFRSRIQKGVVPRVTKSRSAARFRIVSVVWYQSQLAHNIFGHIYFQPYESPFPRSSTTLGLRRTSSVVMSGSRSHVLSRVRGDGFVLNFKEVRLKLRVRQRLHVRIVAVIGISSGTIMPVGTRRSLL